jgi:N-acetylmuramic acid 6-phosphate etherase
MKELYMAIDIGATRINGVVVSKDDYCDFISDGSTNNIKKRFPDKVERIRSVFYTESTAEDLIHSISELLEKLIPDKSAIKGIGISVHGGLLMLGNWKDKLETYFSCKVAFINAIEACAIGTAELGYLFGDRIIGVMTADEGIALMVWRNGRKWRPGDASIWFGNVPPPVRSFDKKKDLLTTILSAARLYALDEIYLSVGWIDAAIGAGDNLAEELHSLRMAQLPALHKPVKLTIPEEGKDRLQLLGATALIIGDRIAGEERRTPEYGIMQTEIPYDQNLMLQQLRADEIVKILWKAEEQAGRRLEDSLGSIAGIAERMADVLLNSGRIIYAGAGTSGRIAAVDALEIPCTYGLGKDKILAVIAGGVADAAVDIEYNFEEDTSAVPDMLLLNLTGKDMVIGISASGSAYFVQSALAFAKFRGAYAVMIQNAASPAASAFCHVVIPLHSGAEVVAGSTRMKAGTSTKKVLNMLSTTAMILLGKVYGSFMIDVACINNKLKLRAQSILGRLFGLSAEESEKILAENDYDLKKVCNKYFLNNR